MPPSGKLAVTIHSMQLNSDMDPDVWPFDNHADVYGRIEITADGTTEVFDLAEIEGSDFPHWTENNKFVAGPPLPASLFTLSSASMRPTLETMTQSTPAPTQPRTTWISS